MTNTCQRQVFWSVCYQVANAYYSSPRIPDRPKGTAAPGETSRIGILLDQVNGVNQGFFFNYGASFVEPAPIPDCISSQCANLVAGRGNQAIQLEEAMRQGSKINNDRCHITMESYSSEECDQIRERNRAAVERARAHNGALANDLQSCGWYKNWPRRN
jgi:hypothetical protein